MRALLTVLLVAWVLCFVPHLGYGYSLAGGCAVGKVLDAMGGGLDVQFATTRWVLRLGVFSVKEFLRNSFNGAQLLEVLSAEVDVDALEVQNGILAELVAEKLLGHLRAERFFGHVR